MNDPDLPTACPRCGSSAIVRTESEKDHQSRETLPLVLAAAFLVLGVYFAFVVYAYLAYPLTVLIFTAIAAWVAGRREKRRRYRREPDHGYYCNDCGGYFVSSDDADESPGASGTPRTS